MGSLDEAWVKGRILVKHLPQRLGFVPQACGFNCKLGNASFWFDSWTKQGSLFSLFCAGVCCYDSDKQA